MLSQGASSSKNAGKWSLQASTTPMETDCSVNIPHIPCKYNGKLLPTYSTALSKSADEHLSAEYLDNIQNELETLLSKVALRYRILKLENELFDEDEKRSDRRSKASEKPPSAPGKKRREDVRKSKSSVAKIAKHKCSSTYYSAHSQNTDNGSDSTANLMSQQPKEQKLIQPKNDTPNKFWLSVEPYCMPLTNEDLRLLDDLLEQYSDPLIPPIPNLGEHYSKIWATEDMDDIKGTSNLANAKGGDAISLCLYPKADNKLDEFVTGPLTQRLISALMENNMRGDLVGANSDSSSENTNFSNYAYQSYAMMRNGIDIEKRLEKELMAHGMLDYNKPTKDTEDEVLVEIKKIISELSAVSEYNYNSLTKLREATCNEIKRLEIKRKLDIVDHEILELYTKSTLGKAKRKAFNPEEQKEILRLTLEQKTLSDKLETFNQ